MDDDGDVHIYKIEDIVTAINSKVKWWKKYFGMFCLLHSL